MHQHLRVIILITITLSISGCGRDRTNINESAQLQIIPKPNKILLREGFLELTDDFWVIADVGNPATSNLAEILVSSLEDLTLKNVGITDLYSTRKHSQSIQLEIKKNFSPRDKEAYSIEITSPHIKIIAGSERGIYYGIQSLLQILKESITTSGFMIQKMNIKDKPKHIHRGVIINPTNYKEVELNSLIKTITKYKLNYLFFTEEYKTIESLKRLNGNYIQISVVKKFPNDITLVSYGTSRKEMEDIFNSSRNNSDTKGFLLDLTSTVLEDIEAKIILVSEINWSDNSNREFTEIYKEN